MLVTFMIQFVAIPAVEHYHDKVRSSNIKSLIHILFHKRYLIYTLIGLRAQINKLLTTE